MTVRELMVQRAHGLTTAFTEAFPGLSHLQLRDVTGEQHRYELWRILPGRTPREVFLCSIGEWEIPHLHRLTAKSAVDTIKVEAKGE